MWDFLFICGDSGLQKSEWFKKSLMINSPGVYETVPPIHTGLCELHWAAWGQRRSIIHPADWFPGSGLEGRSLSAGCGDRGQTRESSYVSDAARKRKDQGEVLSGNENPLRTHYAPKLSCRAEMMKVSPQRNIQFIHGHSSFFGN